MSVSLFSGLTGALNVSRMCGVLRVCGRTGDVGNIRITDKLLNGFKVEFDGSATSVTVILRIKGGL